MCGRFLFDADFDELYRKLSIYENTFVVEKKDYRPTDLLPTIITGHDKYKILPMTWGLKDYKASNRLIINARSESIFKKPRYSNITRNRCVIPATRFFESETRGNKKITHIFGTENIMFFAGIYEQLHENASVALITMNALDDIKQYHPRMPVSLDENDIWSWITGTNEIANGIILSQRPRYKLLDESVQLSFF